MCLPRGLADARDAAVMRLLKSFLPSVCLLALSACDSSDSNGLPLSLYENEVGEAVVDYLIKSVPDPSPGVPKSWTVVLGEIDRSGVFEPATQPFLEKFQKDGRRVISARVLEVTEPNNMIIDPDLRVAVYVLQLRLMTQRGAQDWDVQAAWSYKDFFQRLDLEATQRDGRWVVTQKSVLDGNWPPAEKTEEKGS